MGGGGDGVSAYLESVLSLEIASIIGEDFENTIGEKMTL